MAEGILITEGITITQGIFIGGGTPPVVYFVTEVLDGGDFLVSQTNEYFIEE